MSWAKIGTPLTKFVLDAVTLVNSLLTRPQRATAMPSEPTQCRSHQKSKQRQCRFFGEGRHGSTEVSESKWVFAFNYICDAGMSFGFWEWFLACASKFFASTSDLIWISCSHSFSTTVVFIYTRILILSKTSITWKGTHVQTNVWKNEKSIGYLCGWHIGMLPLGFPPCFTYQL